jgi:8-oxo-dGTP pyrophosphatase MutT (NUDIX family)
MRNTAIPAVYILLTKSIKGKTYLLMLERFNTGYEDGKFSLIAGHVESGESAIQCAIREAKEEAGIIIKSEDLEFCHLLHRTQNHPQQSRIDIFFQTTKWQGEPQNMEPDKCSQLKWFPINQLPANTIPYIKKSIQSILQNQYYLESE